MEDIELWLGDCLELMKNIPDKSVNLILTDLPYGTTACKWDSIIPFDRLWDQYKRIIVDGGATVLFGSEPFSSLLRVSNIEEFKYDIIWEKERPTNIFNMKKQFGKVHETISVFYKKQCTYNPIMEERKGNYISPEYDLLKCANNGTETYNFTKYKYSKDYDSSKKYPRSVVYFVRDRDKFHPTQKPIELLKYLLKTFSNEFDLILDNTMGSGTTGVACRDLNRKFIGIEMDEKYFNVAKNRINNGL